MSQQVSALPGKEALNEFRQAFQSGEMQTFLERHNDEALMELLRQWRKSESAHILWKEAGLVLALGLQISLGGGWSRIDDRESRNRAARAWKTISQRIKASSLQTLLGVHQLKINQLAPAICDGMIKQLNLATASELEKLNLRERKELVRFTLRQLCPRWDGYPVLDSPQRQAAALGYLALATLKQPGAEKPDRSGLNATHTHLTEAIAEYLSSLGRPD